MKRVCVAIVLLLLAPAALADDGSLRLATLGDFKLDSGEAIRGCRVGYRTWGQLNAAKSNVVVLTTWFAGTSAGLAAWIGPGKLFDPSKDFIVVVDAFGDGVSSSPSNSDEQPGAAFPLFTVRDMVRAQHDLLTRNLGISHVFAVAGLSMGGMQTFQWIVSYSDFMDRAISIVGTPKQTSYDLLLWRTELGLLDALRDAPEGGRRAMNTISLIQEMGLVTPEYVVGHTKPDGVDALIHSRQEALGKLDPLDYASQLRAMIAHDVYRDFGGSAEAAAKAIRARLLVVVSLQDHMVNPAPSRELARLAGAEVLTLTGNCGHLATGCEEKMLSVTVHRFLER